MKNTRKLIPALAMLLIAAVMMSTATFAWFSMNQQVTATGLQVTAKSDNVWLAINAGSSFDANGTAKEVSSTQEEVKLFPVMPKVDPLTVDNVTLPASWQFGYSNATDSSDVNSEGYTECATLDGYVASETFSIGLSNISGAASASNLRLTKVELPADTGISVVVVCGDNVYLHTDSASGLNEQIAATVTTAGVTVTVYYFINGEDDMVYTDRVAELTGKVVLTFNVG